MSSWENLIGVPFSTSCTVIRDPGIDFQNVEITATKMAGAWSDTRCQENLCLVSEQYPPSFRCWDGQTTQACLVNNFGREIKYQTSIPLMTPGNEKNSVPTGSDFRVNGLRITFPYGLEITFVMLQPGNWLWLNMKAIKLTARYSWHVGLWEVEPVVKWNAGELAHSEMTRLHASVTRCINTSEGPVYGVPPGSYYQELDV